MQAEIRLALTRMIEISASILNIEENEIQKFYDLEVAKIDYFHVDVMDGLFVKNNTVEKMIKYGNELVNTVNTPIEVHLMVRDVKKYVDEFSAINPQIIYFQTEEMDDSAEIMEIINYIKDRGIQVGIAVSPNTKLEKITEFIKYLNGVLIMTVEPGYGGQALIPETISKIKEAREYIEDNNLEAFVAADGGINLDNIDELKQAGLERAIVGSSLVKSENLKETIEILRSGALECSDGEL